MASDNIYVNAFFGFCLQIPEDWKLADKSAMEALVSASERNTSGSSGVTVEKDFPLLVLGEREPVTGAQYRRFMQILSTKLSAQLDETSAEHFLQSMVTLNKEKHSPRNYSGAPEFTAVNGKEFWKIYFTQPSDVLWHGAEFVTSDQSHLLQFILMSPTADGLRSFENMMGSVHFDEWAKRNRPSVENLVTEPGASAYHGKCPKEVRFKATIHVDHAPVSLKYFWERSDGSSSKEQSIEIPANGALTRNLVDIWTAGIPRASVWRISDRLHVRLEDLDFVSSQASVVLSCQAVLRQN